MKPAAWLTEKQARQALDMCADEFGLEYDAGRLPVAVCVMGRRVLYRRHDIEALVLLRGANERYSAN